MKFQTDIAAKVSSLRVPRWEVGAEENILIPPRISHISDWEKYSPIWIPQLKGEGPGLETASLSFFPRSSERFLPRLGKYSSQSRWYLKLSVGFISRTNFPAPESSLFSCNNWYPQKVSIPGSGFSRECLTETGITTGEKCKLTGLKCYFEWFSVLKLSNLEGLGIAHVN